MTQNTRRPRILCVGAYERDNFGDLLFQMVSERYLRDADVIWAAPFAADMTELTGLDVPAFGPLLEAETFDAIWTVGGEVGGTSVEYAYKAALGSSRFKVFKDADADTRRAMLAEHQGSVPVESPYLPRPSAYAPNILAASVLNSIGIAAVAALPPEKKASVTGILREATHVSVRDRRSSSFLTEEGIAHSLEPDLVQSIAVSRPRPDLVRGDYVLVQVSQPHLGKVGIEAFAKAIIDSAVLSENPVRLFLAGTAPGHDSAERYQQIIDMVLAADPERRISISTTIKPWDRVDEIAGAKLWIGGSLHGRIVASAYGVPRVSLAKRKLDEYAQTWDPDMPWGVHPRTLGDAASRALAIGAKGTDDRGTVLGARAHENMLAAVAHVNEWVAQGAPANRVDDILSIRNAQWSQLMLENSRADARQRAAEAKEEDARARAAERQARTASKTPSLARRVRRRAGAELRRARRTADALVGRVRRGSPPR